MNSRYEKSYCMTFFSYYIVRTRKTNMLQVIISMRNLIFCSMRKIKELVNRRNSSITTKKTICNAQLNHFLMLKLGKFLHIFTYRVIRKQWSQNLRCVIGIHVVGARVARKFTIVRSVVRWL